MSKLLEKEILPFDDAGSERAVLAVAVRIPNSILEIEGYITENDFLTPHNKYIFSTLYNLCINEGITKFDETLLINELRRLDLLSLCGGVEYVSSIFNTPVLKDNLQSYINKVLENSSKKYLYDTLSSLSQEVKSNASGQGARSSSELLHLVEEGVTDALMHSTRSSEATNIGSGIIEFIDNLVESPPGVKGLKTGFNILDERINGLTPGSLTVLVARPKIGKAVRHGEVVWTPKGPINIENICVGDKVIGSDGNPYNVTGVFPQGMVDIYKVCFSDGSAIDVCGEHLWTVTTKHSRDNPSVMSTVDILKSGVMTDWKDGRAKYQIPMAGPLKLEKRNLVIPPYLMGVLLGDGCLTSGGFFVANSSKEIQDFVRESLPDFFEIRVRNSGFSVVSTAKPRNNYLSKYLHDVGLRCKAEKKFIPKDYLLSSTLDRLELLRGLMDTDGFISKRGLQCYSTASSELAKNIVMLIQTLGGKASRTVKNKTFYKKVTGGKKYCLPSYRVLFTLPIGITPYKKVFKKNRFLETRSVRTTRNARSIFSINLIGKDYATCIMVDSPDKLFVASNCIVTHNTSVLCEWAKYISVVSDNNKPILYIDTEMSTEEIKKRLLSNLSGVRERDISNGSFQNNSQEVEKVYKAGEIVKRAKFFHKHTPGIKVEQVASLAKKYKVRENIGALFFDYIKLTDMTLLKNAAEHQLLGHISQVLKDLASTLEIPVITAAQIGRAGSKTRNGLISSDMIADSDRLLRYCNTLLAFSKKSGEEIEKVEKISGKTGVSDYFRLEGTHRLQILETRAGGSLTEGLNIVFFRDILKVKEADKQPPYVFDQSYSSEEENF